MNILIALLYAAAGVSLIFGFAWVVFFWMDRRDMKRFEYQILNERTLNVVSDAVDILSRYEMAHREWVNHFQKNPWDENQFKGIVGSLEENIKGMEECRFRIKRLNELAMDLRIQRTKHI